MDTAQPILVTRELDSNQKDFARRLGLNPIIRPAIRASFPGPGENLLSLADHYAGTPWVFTSKNGVKGFFGLEAGPEPVAGLIRNLKEKHPVVYAVGNKTAEALSDVGVEARVPVEQNAIGLAGLIISDIGRTGAADKLAEDSGPGSAGTVPSSGDSGAGPGRTKKYSENSEAGSGLSGDRADRAVIHWCGNRSREELGTLLDEAGIRLIQQVVYHTKLNEFTLPETDVDAILFFSPSAVEAFRHSVGFNRELPELFAIGTTTAEALSLESGANVHVPSEPSTEHLLELAADVLASLKQT